MAGLQPDGRIASAVQAQHASGAGGSSGDGKHADSDADKTPRPDHHAPPPDDDDGGLVIRATPGGRKVGVIDLGDTGVRRQAVAPRKIGRYTWWAVETADGRQGWVAALYLAPDQPVAPNTLCDFCRPDGDGDFVTGVG